MHNGKPWTFHNKCSLLMRGIKSDSSSIYFNENIHLYVGLSFSQYMHYNQVPRRLIVVELFRLITHSWWTPKHDSCTAPDIWRKIVRMCESMHELSIFIIELWISLYQPCWSNGRRDTAWSRRRNAWNVWKYRLQNGGHFVPVSMCSRWSLSGWHQLAFLREIRYQLSAVNIWSHVSGNIYPINTAY